MISWATATFSRALRDGDRVYTVETDAGNTIEVFRDRKGDYWCHGYTFGGHIAPKGPFSVYGNDVDQVLKDDGWKLVPCCVAQSSDVIVWYDWRTDTEVKHSGIFRIVYQTFLGSIDQDATTVMSKRGMIAPLGPPDSLETLQGVYGGYYACYSKGPKEGGICCEKGRNERGEPYVYFEGI